MKNLKERKIYVIFILRNLNNAYKHQKMLDKAYQEANKAVTLEELISICDLVYKVLNRDTFTYDKVTKRWLWALKIEIALLKTFLPSSKTSEEEYLSEQYRLLNLESKMPSVKHIPEVDEYFYCGIEMVQERAELLNISLPNLTKNEL